jgi:hypothetical protein
MEQQIEFFIQNNPVIFASIIALLLLWTIPWKGYALWRAARNKDVKWFIVLLLVNTLAILEIIYIFKIDKNK